ncbi:MAG TPA: hypothetical protein VHV28_06795 [Solirubrobacteraceae bacterium]|jgi:hypothetical protein|nr:hypothetical protein [Solirubrobacteraceae bacterium]
MLRIRTAALSLTAAGATALALGLSAGPASAHGDGHHSHHSFGHHHGHAVTGVVQSVDTTANTAVVTLGASRQDMHRAWDHNGSSDSSTQTVTLDLSSAAIYDATAMQQHCHGPSGSSNPSATTTTLSSVQTGDVVSFAMAVDHETAHQDLASGTAVPVSKLVDWGQASSGDQPQSKSKSDARRFFQHA